MATQAQGGPMASARRAFDWTFRSRQTGRITIFQLPNIPLTVWIVAVVVDRLGSFNGTAATFLDIVRTIALMTWAGLEIAQGVNPFRRGLGLVVLVWALIGLLGSAGSLFSG